MNNTKKIIALTVFMLSLPQILSAQEKLKSEQPAAGDSAVVQTKSDKNIQKKSDENTLEKCKDGVDNDLDSYVDCDDQDCHIFAMCVTSKQPETAAGAGAASQTVSEQPAVQPVIVEKELCGDKIDNDKNGLTDCFDPQCHSDKMCEEIIYDKRPEPANKPMGLLLAPGLGMALPNYYWKDVRIDSDYGNNIPFDPDMGVINEFKVALIPLRWLGFGLDVTFGKTFASNRNEYLSISDPPDRYKYTGEKYFGSIGAFLRFQFPFKIFVPRADISFSYAYARYHWRVYDSSTNWDDIEYGISHDSYPPHDSRYKEGDHFTITAAPGFDVFIVPRFFALGLSVRLPVYSSRNSGMDNVAIMTVATFTPKWREPRPLKKEYQKAAEK